MGKRQQKGEMVSVSVSNRVLQLEFILHLFWRGEYVPLGTNSLSKSPLNLKAFLQLHTRGISTHVK